MQVLPTPESPISSSLNSRSYVFLAIFVSRTGSSKLIYERFQLKLQLLLLSLGLSHSHRGTANYSRHLEVYSGRFKVFLDLVFYTVFGSVLAQCVRRAQGLAGPSFLPVGAKKFTAIF